jgi:selenocysteine-specific elongation factor
VQLYLARPVAVAVGDCFVLRRSSPSSTIAGGTVVNTAPRRHRRHDPDVITSLERRSAGNALAEELRNHPLGITERDLQKAVGSDPIEVSALDARRAGQWLFAPDAWAALTERAVAMLADYHRDHPLRTGMPRGELASRLRVPADVLAFLAKDGVIAEEGREVRDPAHRPRLSDAAQAQADALVELLGMLPFAPPSLPEVMRQSGVDAEVMRILIEQRRIVRLSEDVAFTMEAYEEAVAQVMELIRRDGSASVGTVRDRLQTSRRPTLALLDHLDRQQITRRVGDVRVAH